jgi:signal transduction histidine kinase
MRPILPLIHLALLLIIITACSQKELKPADPAVPGNSIVLADSLSMLDSVVNVFKTSDNQKARGYSRQAMSIALRLNTQEALAKAYLMMGIAYMDYNNDSSYFFFNKSLHLANRYRLEKLKPTLFYGMAMIYRAASDTRTALNYLDSSISYSQSAGDYTSLSNSYNELGNLKTDLMDSASAKVMYDSAFKVASRYGLKQQMAVALASTSRFEGTEAGSAELYKRALRILQGEPGSEEVIAMILVNLGTNSSNPDSAIPYLTRAIEIARAGHASAPEMAAYNSLAYCYLDKHDPAKAELCLTEHAIPLAEQMENYDWLSSLYDTYADVLIAQGKPQQAFEYERKSLNTRAIADEKLAASQVRLLASLLDVKNKELRIQANETQLNLKEARIQRLIFWFSLLLMASILVIFFIIWRMQRNRIRYQAALITSARRLIESEENQKSRVSMELHDLVTPFYTTMLQQLERAEIRDTAIDGYLRNSITNISASIRNISHRMNSSFIEQLRIKELVDGLCEDLQRATAIPIRCVITQETFSLTGEETLHIYRIVQELLTNAIKYVTSGEINISLSSESGHFFILYDDTGSGFDPESTVTNGLGITNIRERARIIGGQAVLDTAPGKGTRWTISIPLNYN